jgi:hypothetical protein
VTVFAPAIGVAALHRTYSTGRIRNTDTAKKGLTNSDSLDKVQLFSFRKPLCHNRRLSKKQNVDRLFSIKFGIVWEKNSANHIPFSSGQYALPTPNLICNALYETRFRGSQKHLYPLRHNGFSGFSLSQK